ncbi:MAG: hypothetical protein M1812_007399 [Candelaria pacifica]|nr:MAG: hypothetical protein M1812_007399 [Candelaria pacifica]
MPLSQAEPTLPFRFVGGFALSTKAIGFILSLQGIYSMLAQLFLVPFVLRRFGSLGTFRFVAISYPMLYFAVPYLVLLPENLRMTSVYFCLIWKVTAQALAYPSNAILLTNAAPSMLVLGAINGIAAATASLCRAFGPTVSGLIQSAGLEKGYSGLAWWVCALVCIVGAIETSWMDDVAVRLNIDDERDEESESREPLMDQIAIDDAITAAGVRSTEEVDNQHGINLSPKRIKN